MKLLFSFGLILIFASTHAQYNRRDTFHLTLEETITLACDSTLDVHVAQNELFVEHLAYKNYIAGKLPSIDLNSSPMNYNRSVNEEYNFVDSTYSYVNQQIINSRISLSLNQVVAKTGGRVYISSDLSRLQNIGRDTPAQYSSNIVKIGISQQLFGFNSYKWNDKLIPLKYRKAKMEYIQSTQSISLQAISYFFNLLKAQKELEIAVTNMRNADTLLIIGKQRSELGLLTKEDSYLLEISLLQSTNAVKTSRQNFEKAKLAFNSFLRLDENRKIDLLIPLLDEQYQIDASQALEFAFENNPQIIENNEQLIEAQRDKERAKVEKRLSSSIDASIGLNKQATSLNETYKSPVNHQSVNFSVRIPIADWGTAKNSFEMATRQEEIARLSIDKSKRDFRQEILSTVFDFNMMFEIVLNSDKIQNLAQKSYLLNLEGFKVGKTNLTQLFDSQNYYIKAQREYINSLESYWYNLYQIRKFTLYDFANNKSLSTDFDDLFELGIFN